MFFREELERVLSACWSGPCVPYPHKACAAVMAAGEVTA